MQHAVCCRAADSKIGRVATFRQGCLVPARPVFNSSSRPLKFPPMTKGSLLAGAF